MKYSCVLFQTGTILKEVKLFTTQPCLVAVGPQKNTIVSYYIAFEGHFLPVMAKNATQSLDQLLKSHFVFNTSYDEDLKNFFRFIEIVFYNLSKDIFLTPRMREIRSKLI